MIYVKPKPGMLVRFPGTTTILPETGAWVEGTYWERRLTDGSVYVADPNVKKKEVEQEAPVTPAVAGAVKELGSVLNTINRKE